MVSALLIVSYPVVMLLETGTGMGMRENSPGTLLLRAIFDVENDRHPSAVALAPIECVAPLLQAAAIVSATRLEEESESLFAYRTQSADLLYLTWKRNQKLSHMLECIVKILANGLGAAGWCQGSAIQTKRLHQEYIALLQSSISLSQNIQSSIQLISSSQSIRETQKGLQEADSVKR